MIVVSVKVHVEAVRQQAFIERFNQVRDAESASKGCIEYSMYQDPTSEDAFFMFEVWESKEDFDQHAARAPFEAFLDCIVSAELYEANQIEG